MVFLSHLSSANLLGGAQNIYLFLNLYIYTLPFSTKGTQNTLTPSKNSEIMYGCHPNLQLGWHTSWHKYCANRGVLFHDTLGGDRPPHHYRNR